LLLSIYAYYLEIRIFSFQLLSKLVHLLFALSLLFMTACSELSKTSQPKSVKVVLAAEMSLLPSTVWVAEARGFFTAHNIELEIREFDSGRNALETMLADDSINIATVAQTPVVFNSFNNESYVIFATMAYSIDDIKVLALKERGINSARDLIGKKIGVTKRSTGHYFLEGYLAHFGLTLNDVVLHDINASELQKKLFSKEMDAITSWEPHIDNAFQQFGEEQLTLLVSPTPFRKDFYFTSRPEYVSDSNESVQRFLTALVDAEKFIKDNPKISQDIVAQKLGKSTDFIKNIWNVFTFEITLEQSILVNLENEAIWAANLSGEKKQVPNYLDYIDIKPLLKVKPLGVNIIH